MNRLLSSASSAHPEIRWLGAIIDDGERFVVTGYQDGMVASDKTGNVTTAQEAIATVVERLSRLVRHS